MIPKVIHYCWFGGKPIPKSAQKCITSWKKYFPDYEIKEWNESNFDVNSIPYTKEAYEKRKYAFVSDYARFWILYNYGGLYFDTDVRVIKSFDDIISRGAFMGIEDNKAYLDLNPGLGIGTEAGTKIYKEILNHYNTLHFLDANGNQLPGTVVKHTTDVLDRHGFQHEDKIQIIEDIIIYPNEFFNPLNDATGKLTITENTRSIHLYSKTWVGNYCPLRLWITRRLHRILGVDFKSKLINLLKRN